MVDTGKGCRRAGVGGLSHLACAGDEIGTAAGGAVQSQAMVETGRCSSERPGRRRRGFPTDGQVLLDQLRGPLGVAAGAAGGDDLAVLVVGALLAPDRLICMRR